MGKPKERTFPFMHLNFLYFSDKLFSKRNVQWNAKMAELFRMTVVANVATDFQARGAYSDDPWVVIDVEIDHLGLDGEDLRPGTKCNDFFTAFGEQEEALPRRKLMIVSFSKVCVRIYSEGMTASSRMMPVLTLVSYIVVYSLF
uniref:C2 domain-containing protein n=1 Tax=Heterorhabditis bacteriophora TaxID=37862 RepID=A0A1I7WJE4_HETBA